jgi:hypothetical protein
LLIGSHQLIVDGTTELGQNQTYMYLITNSVGLVRERTIPIERPPLVGKVNAKFCGKRGVPWSVRRILYGRNLGFLDRNSLEHLHKTFH